MPYTWPSDLDDARRLLTVVGSFWAETYAGSDLVASILHSKAQQQAQAQLDLLELVASFSRLTVPVFHRESWSLLLLRESERNSPSLALWDGTYRFDDGLAFDTPAGAAAYAWPAPPGLAAANAVSDQITQANFTLTRGHDFVLAGGAVRFMADPFAHPAARPAPVFEDGRVVDRVLALWVYAGDYDWDTVHRQFGYALGLKLRSSRPYKELVNAVYDGLVEGTTARCLEDFMSAVCDVPLAKGDEVVKYVLADAVRKWVITDKNAYGFNPAAAPVVAPGDRVRAGDALTDALRFYEFNRGEVPDAVRALALGRGTLSAAFFRELTFENKEVPLLVTEGVDGYTRVEFEVSGWPADVEKFWDDVHAKGVASNDTLAMRLDTRANKTGQPTALALPATVNPLGFLLKNVYRGNAFAVVVRPEAFGDEAVGLHAARFLRKLVPPQTLCFLIVEQAVGEAVTMTGPGTATAPGYEEGVDPFLCNTIDEDIDPADYVTEDVRVFQIGGYCS